MFPSILYIVTVIAKYGIIFMEKCHVFKFGKKYVYLVEKEKVIHMAKCKHF